MPKVALSTGVRLHYQQIGEGPDLVMIHGLTGNLAVWHLKIIPMISNRFRTLTYDLRGHGYSEISPSGYSVRRRWQPTCSNCWTRWRSSVRRSSGTATAPTSRSTSRSPPRTGQRGHRDRGSAAGDDLSPQPRGVGGLGLLVRRARAVGSHGAAGATAPTSTICFARACDVPKKWGPLNGLPRNPKPFLRLIDETTIADRVRGDRLADARPDPRDPDARCCSCTPTGRRSSARTTTCRAPPERATRSSCLDRVGALRAARAAGGRRRATSSSFLARPRARGRGRR